MTLRDLKKRLEAEAKKFKYETDFVKSKVRDLYLIAQQAIDFAQRQEKALKLQRAGVPTKPNSEAPIAPFAPKKSESQALPVLTKRERMTKFLEGDPQDPEFLRYLRVTNHTMEDVRKYVDSTHPEE